MVSIGDRRIGRGERTFIVAEVGVNHNGDPDMGVRLVEAAARAGADAVKFQVFTADEFVGDPSVMYEYVSQGTIVRESMLEMFRRLELTHVDYRRLFACAREQDLIPFATPADIQAVDFLERLDVPVFKIGSDDLVYTPFLQYVAGKGRPVILSTGMADAADIDRAVRVIEGTGNRQMVLLHCVSLYPASDDDVNLSRIPTLADAYAYPVGFSDHSRGVSAAVGAVALGACVLEKHFTLDRSLPGPDHWFSADPEELGTLVGEVRRLERMLGNPRLVPAEAERKMIEVCRRSIVTVVPVSAGTVLRREHLGFKRPGTGLMPYELDQLVGRRVTQDVPSGAQLRWDMVEDPSA